MYKRTGNRNSYWPKASTEITDGDLVILDNTTGYIEPMTTAGKTRVNETRVHGFADDDWNQDVAITKTGEVAGYSSPSSYAVTAKTPTINRGVFHLAISDTSGKAGVPVWYASGGTGAQIFTVTKPSQEIGMIYVGILAVDFSSATANDKQMVLVYPGAFDKREMALQHWMRNHVEQGLLIGFDSSSLVSYTKGIAFVNGKMFSIAYASAALGIVCASHTGRRCAAYVITSAGAAAIVDTGNNTWATGAATATALQDSQYWPTTSLPIFGISYLGSESSDINAGAVRSVRRTVNDFLYDHNVP